MARFGLRIRLPTQGPSHFFPGGDGAWWSRGEDRFGLPKLREIKELEHLRLPSV
jgi:hypothetical protein